MLEISNLVIIHNFSLSFRNDNKCPHLEKTYRTDTLLMVRFGTFHQPFLLILHAFRRQNESKTMNHKEKIHSTRFVGNFISFHFTRISFG